MLVGVVFFLSTVLWKGYWMRSVGSLIVFLPGIFFVHSLEYIVVGIISVFFIYWSSISIAHEKESRVHFHFSKIIQTSSFLFIFGLSLLISSGYYVSLKSVSWEELVPRFRIGEEMTKVIFKIASTVNSSFATLAEGDATVDEFLLSIEQNQKDTGVPLEIPINDSQKNILKTHPEIQQFLNQNNSTLSSNARSEQIAQELFLDQGRKQIASMIGRPVSGNEKIAQVLSLALQNKVVTFLSGEKATQHIPSQAIPFFLSLLLFLTLLSFSSIIVPFCILVAHLLFAFFLWAGWIQMSTVMTEQERLEE